MISASNKKIHISIALCLGLLSSNSALSQLIDDPINDGAADPSSTRVYTKLQGGVTENTVVTAMPYYMKPTGYGICGIMVTPPNGDYAYVTKVLPTTPAEEAGITSGDLIYSINGRQTCNMTAKDIWNNLTGNPGTRVQIVLGRDDKQWTIALKRLDIAQIKSRTVRSLFTKMYNIYGRSIDTADN